MASRRKLARAKPNNIGVPPEVDARLTALCQRRGWKKVEFVRRMVDREERAEAAAAAGQPIEGMRLGSPSANT